MKRIIASLAIAVPLLVLTGCASTGQVGDTRSVQIEIANQRAGSGAITVWIREVGGTQELLGTVPPTETRSFEYMVAQAARYILTAEISGRQRVVSDSFNFPEGSGGVTWDLLSNNITPF